MCFLIPRLHDTTGCQTSCTTGLTTVLFNQLNKELFVQPVVKPGCITGCIHDTSVCQTSFTTGCIIVYTNIYPVVKPVWQPVVSCKRGFTSDMTYLKDGGAKLQSLLQPLINVWQILSGHLLLFCQRWHRETPTHNVLTCCKQPHNNDIGNFQTVCLRTTNNTTTTLQHRTTSLQSLR